MRPLIGILGYIKEIQRTGGEEGKKARGVKSEARLSIDILAFRCVLAQRREVARAEDVRMLRVNGVRV